MRSAATIHQKRLQNYHELITNKKKQDRPLYTAQDWKNYSIARKIKDEPIIPRGKSSDIKQKIIELYRKIGHKSVMSICELFIDRDEPAHLVDQVINEMEEIGYASAEGANEMVQLFAADL